MLYNICGYLCDYIILLCISNVLRNHIYSHRYTVAFKCFFSSEVDDSFVLVGNDNMWSDLPDDLKMHIMYFFKKGLHQRMATREFGYYLDYLYDAYMNRERYASEGEGAEGYVSEGEGA